MFFSLLSRRYSKRSTLPDHTVESVDLNRYVGKWYEIALFPTWFEKGCRCSMAEYSLEDGVILVRNLCRKDGRLVIVSGKAYPVPGTNNSQLKVTFRWPLRSDYWIIALDENYQYAMVGHPKKKYLWILSRTPEMDGDTYRSLVEIARSKGYDVKRLRSTDQTCYLTY